MRRLLLTIDNRRCRFQCRYCFDRFQQYVRSPSIADVEADRGLLNGVDIVYPACDVDLFAREDAAAVMERCLSFNRSLSISTKAEILPETLGYLGVLAAQLADSGMVLKVGVSFATKCRVGELEPGTATYAARLMTLEGLARCGVPRCLVLRPVLEAVPDEEYMEIIDDCVEFTNDVLVGGEWIDASAAGRETTNINWRPVPWLPDEPSWPEQRDDMRLDTLSAYAESRGMTAFDSDLDLMRSLMRDAVSRDI